jgi:small-conductance mechanosensitive channel
VTGIASGLLVVTPGLQSLPSETTLVVIAAAVLAGVGVWYLGEHLRSRFRTATAELVRAGLLLLVAVAGTGVLLGQWNASRNLLVVTGLLEFGVNTAVLVLVTVVLFVAAHAATRVLKRLLTAESRSARRGLTAHRSRILFYLSQVGIYIAAAFGALAFWGIELGDLLLGAGILGVILGLAFQNTLGSILAGFVLIISRPFEVGDWVRIGDHEGFITEITINHVRLRNLDGEHVVLPNEGVNNRTIINRSAEGKLRQTIPVAVDYSVDPERAAATAREAVADLDEVMSHPEPQVLPVRFDDSAVTLEVRVWIDSPTPQRKWLATKAVIYAVKAAFNRENVKIPFPQRELSGRSEGDGLRFDDGDERTGRDSSE